ncbi:NAC domain-containing protein 5 [Cardamine amara subsp. amara]|uniref:NAC domain-containing protein 5 n=1 Tax=Cardamine amara subsp. amara TaxID=228776 RepID=A0ABD1BSZ2_CARAN
MKMPKGFKFVPTDEQNIDDYLRPKNMNSDTRDVDEVISTVTICNFDPWELPYQSRMKSSDQTWYFFVPIEYKDSKCDKQKRKTKSGFWKQNGKNDIVRKRGGINEKIGEKWFLGFKLSDGSNTKWVMHEYHLTFFSPNQEVKFTLCKVMNNEETDISSSSAAVGSEIENTPSLTTRSEGSYTEWLQIHGLLNPRRQSSTGFLDVHEEAPLVESSDDQEWKSYLVDDEPMFMQDYRNIYRPQKSLTVYSTDDNHSDLISGTTSSIVTSSNCDSFGSTNHRIDQIKLESLTQEVSQALRTSVGTSDEKKNNPYDDAQGTEITESKMGQETVKKKIAGLFYKTIQRLV